MTKFYVSMSSITYEWCKAVLKQELPPPQLPLSEPYYRQSQVCLRYKKFPCCKQTLSRACYLIEYFPYIRSSSISTLAQVGGGR